MDTQLGTGRFVVVDNGATLIVLALLGTFGYLLLVLSWSILVLSLMVAAQSTEEDFSTGTCDDAVAALFHCANSIVLAVRAVWRHVFYLARVVYRASLLKHAVAIVQDLYFAALAVFNIVWQVGEAVIFALYLAGMVVLKLALAIPLFTQAAPALVAPLFSLFSTAYSTFIKVMQCMALQFCVNAYTPYAIRLSGQMLSLAVDIGSILLSYIPILFTPVCSTPKTLSCTLLALLVAFALFVTAESWAPSVQAKKGESNMATFKTHRCTITAQLQVNNTAATVSIFPTMQVSRFDRSVPTPPGGQEESIKAESYQVDDALNLYCAWILTLLCYAQYQLELYQARNAASGTRRHFFISRDDVLAFMGVIVMDTTAYIEDVNDDNVETTAESPRDTVLEVYVEYAMVPYGTSPRPPVHTLPSILSGRTSETRNIVDCGDAAHRHLPASDDLDDKSQLVGPEGEDPNKTLYEPVHPAIVSEEPEKTDDDLLDVVDNPAQTLVSSRSLNEKVTQRIAVITLADKVARNFRLGSMWDDCATSAMASRTLLSKAIVRTLVASVESSIPLAEPAVPRFELREQAVANKNPPSASTSSYEFSRPVYKATASALVPAAPRVAASTESLSKSTGISKSPLMVPAAHFVQPFVPPMRRQAEDACMRSHSESASTRPLESESCLKASAPAFVPSAFTVASTRPLLDSELCTCSSSSPAWIFKPTDIPFVPGPATPKSAEALPPRTQLNAAAPLFVPLGMWSDPPDHGDGTSYVRMTTNTKKGRIPHSVRRARKRAKAALALALAEAAAEQ